MNVFSRVLLECDYKPYLSFFISYFPFLYSRCHGPRPPPNPEFTLKPKKKKSNHQSEVTPGSPCPPCPELVWRACVGEHIGAERMVSLFFHHPRQKTRIDLQVFFKFSNRVFLSSFQMVCSDRSQFSCDNLCGNPLPCGNHYCTNTCHALKSQSSSSVEKRSSESCEVCSLPCQKVYSYHSLSSFHLILSSCDHCIFLFILLYLLR